MNLNELITVWTFAGMCKVTRKTVYNWLKTGKAPRHETMIDGRTYFYPDEAKAFADEWKRKHAPK